MQSLEDLIKVVVTSTRNVELDLERMNQDPVWRTIVDSNPTFGADLLIQMYVGHYLQYDKFPHQMPSTNGPGDIESVSIEVKIHAL